jgi:hypothetical protein
MEGSVLLAKFAFVRHKKQQLENLLATLQRYCSNDPPPLNPPPPNAAGASAAQHPLHNAVAAAWPAQVYYEQHGADLPHPAMPGVLNEKRSEIQRTNWRASQNIAGVLLEMLLRGDVVHAPAIASCRSQPPFDARFQTVYGAKTIGHDSWLQVHSELLLV